MKEAAEWISFGHTKAAGKDFNFFQCPLLLPHFQPFFSFFRTRRFFAHFNCSKLYLAGFAFAYFCVCAHFYVSFQWTTFHFYSSLKMSRILSRLADLIEKSYEQTCSLENVESRLTSYVRQMWVCLTSSAFRVAAAAAARQSQFPFDRKRETRNFLPPTHWNSASSFPKRAKNPLRSAKNSTVASTFSRAKEIQEQISFIFSNSLQTDDLSYKCIY